MPDLSLERECRENGYRVIAGIDEAGRGPLAGPVSVAAVILPDDFSLVGLDDSKKLSARQRERLYLELIDHPEVVWKSVHIEAAIVDEINVLRATWRGMAECFEGLSRAADFALIDGTKVLEFPGEHQAVVKGDSRSLSIAAASIIAKVERDRIMVEIGTQYPEYGFEKHKGYGTRAHLEALERYGPCEFHRTSFSPVATLPGKTG